MAARTVPDLKVFSFVLSPPGHLDHADRSVELEPPGIERLKYSNIAQTPAV
jgi:hypothetical protein